MQILPLGAIALLILGAPSAGIAAGSALPQEAAVTPDDVPPVPAVPQLKITAPDPSVHLTMHPPVAVMSGDGRQPYLFCTAQGTLFCQAQMHALPFNSKGKRVYPVRIGTAISRDRGLTWTPWTHEANHDDVFIEGGAVQCADGTIVMLDTFIVSGGQADHGVGEIWRSRDDLRTLDGPATADFYLPTVRYTGSTEDDGRPYNYARAHRSIVAMPNGDLITTVYGHFAGDTARSAYLVSMEKFRTTVVRSRDQGATWAYLATVAVDPGVGTEGFCEPVLVRVSQGPHAGRLLCLMRTGRDLYGAHSDDDGLTWSRPLPQQFPGIDLYATEKWAARFDATPTSTKLPTPEMIGSIVDPDLIEMQNGLLVCAVGVRIPNREYRHNWRSPENGNYLAFSRDGGDSWTEVAQFLSGMPTTQYMGIREVAPDLLYVVYDDSVWRMPGRTMGFQLEVNRSEARTNPGAPGSAAQEDLRIRARSALRQILAEKDSWEVMHAAEAAVACGDGAAVRERFLGEAETAAPPFRTSVWRMLAWTATDPAECQHWLARLEAVFLQLDAPDRITAIEILSKFHQRLSAPGLALARKWADDPVPTRALFGWWALAVADEPEGWREIVANLSSSDAAARGMAGSVLRWLRPTDPKILAALANAADREPEDSHGFTSLVGAAVMLDADPSRVPVWRSRLEAVVRKGPAHARFGAYQALLLAYTPADLAAVEPHLNDPEADGRTGAAWAILRVLGLPRS